MVMLLGKSYSSYPIYYCCCRWVVVSLLVLVLCGVRFYYCLLFLFSCCCFLPKRFVVRYVVLPRAPPFSFICHMKKEHTKHNWSEAPQPSLPPHSSGSVSTSLCLLVKVHHQLNNQLATSGYEIRSVFVRNTKATGNDVDEQQILTDFFGAA